MQTTTEDLIQAGLETADCEKSNNFSTAEKLRIANEALESAYQFIVATWKEYFAAAASFTLPDANVISLGEITTGVPVVPDYPVASPVAGTRILSLPTSPWASVVNSSIALQFYAAGGSSSFATSQGLIPPAGRVLQIAVTVTAGTSRSSTGTIYRDSVATAAFATVPGFQTGGTFSANEGAFGGPVHFNGIQVMDFVLHQASAASWALSASILMQLDQPPSLMFKEIGVTRYAGNTPETIDPLPGYPSRNDWGQGGRRRYWIHGQTLSVWPQVNGVSHAGPYVLDYVPNCPVLAAGDFLPAELERWKELISVKMAKKFLTKRRQDTSDVTAQEALLKSEVVIAAGQRKAEVRKLRALNDHDQMPWRRGALYPRT